MSYLVVARSTTARIVFYVRCNCTFNAFMFLSVCRDWSSTSTCGVQWSFWVLSRRNVRAGWAVLSVRKVVLLLRRSKSCLGVTLPAMLVLTQDSPLEWKEVSSPRTVLAVLVPFISGASINSLNDGLWNSNVTQTWISQISDAVK